MKAILEFDLPEDEIEYQEAHQGHDARDVLSGIKGGIMCDTHYKYNFKDMVKRGGSEQVAKDLIVKVRKLAQDPANMMTLNTAEDLVESVVYQLFSDMEDDFYDALRYANITL